MFVPRLLLAVGGLLIALNALGYLVDPTLPERRRADLAVLDRAADGRQTLRQMLDRPLARFDLAAASVAVDEALIHTDNRRIRPYENWLLWLAGHVYEPLSHTQDPHRIVAGGGGLCGEVALVLNRIAERNGIPARLIGLNGHVVSEIQTGEGWRIADPDYGVVYPVGLQHLQGPDGPRMMRQALQAKGHRRDTIENYVGLFQSAGDNVVLEIGSALSPRLHTAEVAGDWLKWLIPVLLIGAGAMLRKTGSR